MADEWLTVTQAAKLSGYRAYWLRELVNARRIKARKFGPLWQVSQTSLKSYIRAAKKSKDKRRGPKSG